MGRFITSIPDSDHSASVEVCSLLPGVQKVSFKGVRLTASLSDDLEEVRYQELARQLRLVYSFAYRAVNSESYQVSAAGSGFHFTGQDERKLHLLKRKSHPTPKFLQAADRVFADLLAAEDPKRDKTKLFNLLYVWTRAQELQQLRLSLEAQVLLGTIVDDMQRSGADLKGGKLIKGFGIVQTPGDQFAVRILQELNRGDKQTAREELEGFSYLYRLRQRQAQVLNPETPYYLGSDQADVERKNAFLFEITRLYILWRFGLQRYCLKQQGNAFRISLGTKS